MHSGDMSVAGISASLDNGAASLQLALDSTVDAAAIHSQLARFSVGGRALRLVATTFTTDAVAADVVVNIAAFTIDDVQRGVLPLVSTYRGASVSDRAVERAGVPSAVVSTMTSPPGLPGQCDAPTLVAATAGTLALSLVSAQDTGGVAVSSFVLSLEASAATLEAYFEVCGCAHPHPHTLCHVSHNVAPRPQHDATRQPDVVTPGLIETTGPAVFLPRGPLYDHLFVGTYTSTMVVNGLPANTSFVARVQITTVAAQCAVRDDTSPAGEVSTLIGSPPTAPSQLSTTPRPGAADVSWDAPFDRGGLPPLPYVFVSPYLCAFECVRNNHHILLSALCCFSQLLCTSAASWRRHLG